jgi:hypothetical protein
VPFWPVMKPHMVLHVVPLNRACVATAEPRTRHDYKSISQYRIPRPAYDVANPGHIMWRRWSIPL